VPALRREAGMTAKGPAGATHRPAPSRGRSAIGSGLRASCLLLRQCRPFHVLGAYRRPRLALAAPRGPAYPASVTWP